MKSERNGDFKALELDNGVLYHHIFLVIVMSALFADIKTSKGNYAL